ncbi:EAL and HDOD domain-containing protein [Ramlibacter sp. MMS24-I3-19]|uniref:EAL and HDOD domain-containing protein n=1 Tax=Ramlibacter sp. MMS24-I3-19 TaxID=3416606 RepID=UPI003CFDD48C
MSALPLASPAGPEADLVIARQAILDERNAVFGYALTDGSGQAPTAERDAELLVQAVTLSSTPALADRRQLFVRCGWDTVQRGGLELVDPERVVIDLVLPAPAQAAAGATTLAALRQRGFRFAMDHEALGSVWRGWIAHASFLKLDLERVPAPAHAAITRAARSLPLRVIAIGVNDHAKHEHARGLGLELLQGSWFSRPIPVPRTTLRPNQAVIAQLISLLRREADVADIEELLKRDASLSLQLLRLLNSGAFGLSSQVTSFRGAVMLLGMQRILRWATVLLATSSQGTPALAQSAVVRGRLVELLAVELLGADHGDPAFVVGVFSLLEALTGRPMASVLDGLALPEPVAAALLERSGVYAPLLALAEACEAGDDRAFAELADRLLLSGHQINMAHLQALAWAEELLAT